MRAANLKRNLSLHIKVKRILSGSAKWQDTKRAAERTGRCEEEGWTGWTGWRSVDFSPVPRRPPACGHTPGDSCVRDQGGQGGHTRAVEVDKVLQVGGGEDF